MLIGVACFEQGISATALLNENAEGLEGQNLVIGNDNVAISSPYKVRNDHDETSFWRLTDLSQQFGLESCASGGVSELGKDVRSGRWCEFGYDEISQALVIATDVLGLLWIFYAQVGSRWYFGTDFRAVSRLARESLTINDESLLLELALGYVPDDETIFHEIRLIPPGVTMSVNASGKSQLELRKPVFGDKYFGVDLESKFQRLDELIQPMLSDLSTACGNDYCLSLSAGYDSRYILASLERFGFRPPSLFTFGEPESMECKNAAKIAKKAGLRTSGFSFKKGDWQQWRRGIQSLGHSGTVQMCGWSEDWFGYLKKNSNSVFIGYLGDALSGKHLGLTAYENRSDWVKYWVDWSKGIGWSESSLLRPEVNEEMSRLVRQRAETSAMGIEIAAPHQLALHLDLFGRQRRWVASQPQMISRHLSPLLFFYQSDFMDFWLNLPHTDLMGQNLYLAYAKNRFPKFFPASERDQRTAWMRMVERMQNLRGLVLGKDQPAPVLPVDRKKIVSPNRDHILSLIEAHGEVLNHRIEVRRLKKAIERYPNSGDVTDIQIIRITNLLLLLDLRNG